MNKQLNQKRWLILLLICYSTTIMVQTISGKVEDLQGNVIPFVNVT